jgi:hypothetical protein
MSIQPQLLEETAKNSNPAMLQISCLLTPVSGFPSVLPTPDQFLLTTDLY